MGVSSARVPRHPLLLLFPQSVAQVVLVPRRFRGRLTSVPMVTLSAAIPAMVAVLRSVLLKRSTHVIKCVLMTNLRVPMEVLLGGIREKDVRLIVLLTTKLSAVTALSENPKILPWSSIYAPMVLLRWDSTPVRTVSLSRVLQRSTHVIKSVPKTPLRVRMVRWWDVIRARTAGSNPVLLFLLLVTAIVLPTQRSVLMEAKLAVTLATIVSSRSVLWKTRVALLALAC